MALKKNKDGTGKVNWEGNLSGRAVPRKAQAGFSKRSPGARTNSLPQPGPTASPLSAGATPRRSKRSKPGPSLPPLS